MGGKKENLVPWGSEGPWRKSLSMDCHGIYLLICLGFKVVSLIFHLGSIETHKLDP